MWHLYKEGFKPREIARIYKVKQVTIETTLATHARNLKL
jgi:uncharacterized protein YpbB